MEFEVGLLKFDQILDNIISIEKEEITFDIGTSEIFKKGFSHSSLKIKNLLHSRIAMRISIPKDRFKVSPIYSYLESQETFTYKFTYIYKEKSNESINKNFCVFEMIQTPKIKIKENINPMSLFDYILKNNIPVKGLEKRIPIKIFNSLSSNNENVINTAFITSEKRAVLRTSSTIFPNQKKELNEDVNDPKLLCDLLKQNMIYSGTGANKYFKDQLENKILNIFNKTCLYTKFLRFFKIDDNSLKQVFFTYNKGIKYLEYLKVPKHYYLFTQGDQSRYFFGIITGGIVLRIRNNNKFSNETTSSQLSVKKLPLKSKKTFLSKSNPNLKSLHLSFIPYNPLNESENLEIDYMKLGKGSCFGEWGLIYNLHRTTSAVTIEDSEFFILSKDHFLDSFGKNIYKAENERKDFLIKCFPILKEMHRTKIDEIYRKITIEIACNNQILYLENSKAEYLYLIIEGECRLEKNLIEKENDTINSKRINLLRVGIGDFSGFEHITDVETYGTSLVSACEATALMRININLWPDIKNQIIKFLKPFSEQRFKYVSERFSDYLRKKLRIKYHHKITPSIKNESIIKRDEEEKLEKLENLIQTVERKVIPSPSKIFNTVPTKTFITSTISSNISYPLLHNTHNKSSCNTINYKRINTSKDRKNNFEEDQLIRQRVMIETEDVKPVNESYIDEGSFKGVRTKISSNQTKRTKIRFCRSSIKDCSEIGRHAQVEHKKSNSNFTFSFSKKIKNAKLKIVGNKVKNTLRKWEQTIAVNKYHSGNFDLPFYTLTKNE